MTKTPTTLNDLFNEIEAQPPPPEPTPAERAATDAQRKAEIEKEIRQGLRDESGDWIEQPEADEEGEDNEEGGDDADED